MLFAKQLIRKIEAILIVTDMHQVKDCILLCIMPQTCFNGRQIQDYLLCFDQISINMLLFRKHWAKIRIPIINASDKSKDSLD